MPSCSVSCVLAYNHSIRVIANPPPVVASNLHSPFPFPLSPIILPFCTKSRCQGWALLFRASSPPADPGTSCSLGSTKYTPSTPKRLTRSRTRYLVSRLNSQVYRHYFYHASNTKLFNTLSPYTVDCLGVHTSGHCPPPTVAGSPPPASQHLSTFTKVRCSEATSASRGPLCSSPSSHQQSPAAQLQLLSHRSRVFPTSDLLPSTSCQPPALLPDGNCATTGFAAKMTFATLQRLSWALLSLLCTVSWADNETNPMAVFHSVSAFSRRKVAACARHLLTLSPTAAGFDSTDYDDGNT